MLLKRKSEKTRITYKTKAAAAADATEQRVTLRGTST